ncbi:Molybdopterin molybdenumtransferase [hydrothermal vent metagenome]|uniref:molybdopterin molybdotransferase n=1 Tax=hydrothermal vent metagenome TaxID=652676 RepID=A0A3B1A445_9ZZZZ
MINKLIPVQPSCNDFDPNSLSVNQATTQINTLVATASQSLRVTERVSCRSAFGRVLAQDIIANFSTPPYDNSAMDGYAINAQDIPKSDTSNLNIVGTSWAGKPFNGEVKIGECIRIMTGAKMPQSADTVIMQEHVIKNDNSITINTGHCAKQNVRYIGEDIKVGDTILKTGKNIGAAELGVLASMGLSEVIIFRKLRVAIFSTGDELRGVGEPLDEGQIYDSNRYTLFGMLQKPYIELLDMGVIPDIQSEIELAFEQAANVADVVITSGGVSVGDADYVKEILEKIGSINFWKIAMKPGRPLAFGKINNAIFFGLPGNPVSVMATFSQFALPAIRALAGQTKTKNTSYQVKCNSELKKRAGRVDFQRGYLSTDEQGQLTVSVSGLQDSHILSSMSYSNCFIILPQSSTNVAVNSIVEVQPYNEWLY